MCRCAMTLTIGLFKMQTQRVRQAIMDLSYRMNIFLILFIYMIILIVVCNATNESVTDSMTADHCETIEDFMDYESIDWSPLPLSPSMLRGKRNAALYTHSDDSNGSRSGSRNSSISISSSNISDTGSIKTNSLLMHTATSPTTTTPTTRFNSSTSFYHIVPLLDLDESDSSTPDPH